MLKELTLESLGRTRAAKQFNEAMDVIKQSLDEDGDVEGTRTVTLKLSFKPNDRGYIESDISVETRTPRRKIKTLAAFEEGKLKIDVVSDDVTQPFLDNIAPINGKGGVE